MIEAPEAGLAAAGILATAWVVVTALGRACRHEWENQGEARAECYEDDMGGSRTEYIQPVRCKKCGKVRSFYC